KRRNRLTDPPRHPPGGPQNASQRADPRPAPQHNAPEGPISGGSWPLCRSAGRLTALTAPRRRDPARNQKRTLFLVEDNVSHIRQTARVADATKLPVDIAEEDRSVRLAVVVHEHKLLAKLVLEIPQIAPRPLLDHRCGRGMMIDQAHQLVLVHATDNDS